MHRKLGNAIMMIPRILVNINGGIFIDREEILKKSRQENDISDERTKYIGLKGSNFPLVFLWIVLSRVANFDDPAQYAMGLLITSTCFSNFAYQSTQNKTKTVIFFAVMFLRQHFLSSFKILSQNLLRARSNHE